MGNQWTKNKDLVSPDQRARLDALYAREEHHARLKQRAADDWEARIKSASRIKDIRAKCACIVFWDYLGADEGEPSRLNDWFRDQLRKEGQNKVDAARVAVALEAIGFTPENAARRSVGDETKNETGD